MFLIHKANVEIQDETRKIPAHLIMNESFPKVCVLTTAPLKKNVSMCSQFFRPSLRFSIYLILSSSPPFVSQQECLSSWLISPRREERTNESAHHRSCRDCGIVGRSDRHRRLEVYNSVTLSLQESMAVTVCSVCADQ